MASLIAATRNPDFPAQIALVLSNRPDAPGLATAKSHGIATAAVDHKIYAGREAFEGSLQAMLDVPAHWSLIALLCIGYPVEESETPELELRGWQGREGYASAIWRTN